MLADVFATFVEQSPVSVMMRALMERIFRPERLDEIFETHAKVQYTRELLFSTLVNLMSFGLVRRIQPSVNAAYKAKAAEMNVNRSAVYKKLNGVEPQVSTALLRKTAAELGQLIQQMGAFQQFPPRQKPASFNLDAVMRQLEEAGSRRNH